MIVYNGSSRWHAYQIKHKYDLANQYGLQVKGGKVVKTKIIEKVINKHYIVVVELEGDE